VKTQFVINPSLFPVISHLYYRKEPVTFRYVFNGNKEQKEEETLGFEVRVGGGGEVETSEVPLYKQRFCTSFPNNTSHQK
jgi:hypothetical protein